LIDLGKWLGGEYAINEPLRPEHLEKLAAASQGGIPDNRGIN